MFGMGDGMNGWEGYQLGRLDAESDQSMARLVQRLRDRHRSPAINVNAVMAHNQALAAQNHALWNRVDELERAYSGLARDYNIAVEKYQRLDTWADIAAAKLRELGLIKPRE